MHLHEFITSNRNGLISRTRAKVSTRPWPSVSPEEMENGIPLFLTQLAETLRLENTEAPYSATAIGSSATLHGRDLLALGFSVSQVVHDYGDVCQAVTELAVEREAEISAEEFNTLNRCLDNAIAEAVTEYGRLQTEAAIESGRLQMESVTESGRLRTKAAAESGRLETAAATESGRVDTAAATEHGRLRTDAATESGRVETAAATESGRVDTEAATEHGRLRTHAATESGRLETAAATQSGRLQQATSAREEVERLGHLAHELRNKLHTALLSFQALRSGKVGIGGSTGAALGRSLAGLRDLIDRSLAEVRLEAGMDRRERVSLPVFMEEVSVAANLHAEHRDIQLTVERVDPALAVNGDPQLLASAVMNLLQNAFKYTPAHGRVTLRTQADNARVLIEVEDECGGLAHNESEKEMFRSFGDRRKDDRSGLGLGLSISRKAIQANGGEIRTRDIPGKGCVFTIDLPSTA
jgi:signal transduction histidine kinase